MKKFTIIIDKEKLERIKVMASEKGTDVSTMIRTYLYKELEDYEKVL
jgi:predicted DNA binding CopG/RHH family protein